MALTPFVRVAQTIVRAVSSGIAESVNAATFIGRAVVGYPSTFVRAATYRVRGVFVSDVDIRVPQFFVRAVTVSFAGNPKVRAWGYSQDGHDFYVLHLGAQETIVYDATTGSWSSWDSPGRNTWRAGYGMDWLGMAKDNYLGGAVTQVVAGDENLGVLWTLNPSSGVDQDPVDPDTPVPFTRAVRGGIPVTERDNLRCSAVWLRISTGEPSTADTSIRLRFSDDQGATWYDAGVVNVNTGEFGQTIYWRSLGLIRPPLRIFEFTDIGAMVRIDGADVDAG